MKIQIEDLSPWAQLAARVMQAEGILPELACRSIHLGDGSEERFYKLEGIDEAIREEVDAAIDSYLADLSWPAPMADQTNEILRMRTRAAITFAFQHCDSEDAGTPVVIPFPDLAPMAAIRWFLIDWWYRHGRKAYAQDRS